MKFDFKTIAMLVGIVVVGAIIATRIQEYQNKKMQQGATTSA